MIKFLYYLGVNLTKGLLPLLSIFSKKINRSLHARKLEKILLQQYQRPTGKVYWFHCASLGEYEQAKPLINHYKNTEKVNIFITFFSPSGYDKIKPQGNNQYYITFLPLESSSCIKKMANLVKPDYIFWIKYELWLINLSTLIKMKIPIALVSATINNNHFVFKFWAKPWKQLLTKFKFIFTQNKASFSILKLHNSSTYLTGDTRFDNSLLLAQEPYDNIPLSQWIGKHKVMVIGSSWQEEEAVVVNCIKKLAGWKIIIAPHDISATHLIALENLLVKYNIKFNFWSTNFVKENNVVVVDNIGLLSKIYRYANIAFVGGGFRNALHNILEPLAYGIFVITGPTINKNWEAIDAKNAHILAPIESSDDLLEVIENYEKMLLPKATIIKEFVSKHSGATEVITKFI